ncbi:MAG: hypothetical protein QOK42_160 [Frankiaceae bacterium]|nr:hypothetical protein [Frankiaceae bacterium]
MSGYVRLMQTPTPALRRARRRFQRFYPEGFHDSEYVALERDYKWQAHRTWEASLGRDQLKEALSEGTHREAAAQAVRIESRTNLLFSFEKMAVRDAVATDAGARDFVEGLYDWLHGSGSESERFERWVETVRGLPRRQTRVLTWPVATVFGFIARPRVHIFLKPTVTRVAAERMGLEFDYRSAVQWSTYSSLLSLAREVKGATSDWRPRDMIDVQSFIWVQGSDEYS